MKSIRFTMFLLLLITLIFSCGERDIDVPKNFDNEIYEVMHNYQDKENFVGMGLLYYSENIDERYFYIGKADVEKNINIDIHSIYDIGSTTKMFISIIILQLAEEDKLNLNSPVAKWIDNIPFGDIITVSQLLNHTSGLNDYLSNARFLDVFYSDNERIYTIDDIINAGIEDTNGVEQGSWKYSNTNYLLLGKIIETITLNTVGQELKERIFNQANMTNTYYMPECSTEQIPDLATGYQFGISMKTDKNYFLFSAAGGIVSTLNDMQKFALWLINSSYLDKMISDPVDCLIENGLTTTYGQGIIIAENVFSTTMFGHGGTSFGFKSEFWFSKETGEVIIFFVNDYMHNKNYGKFRKSLDTIIQSYK